MTRSINKKLLLVLILVPFFLLFFLHVAFADALPTAEDINDLAQKARQITDSFFAQTFTIRMQYEYSGRFLNEDDKDCLRKIAEKTSAELDQIANTQLAFKQSIESYQGPDWESRFGQTGLWRRLSADLYRTTLAKLEVDYYRARAFDLSQQNQILQEILRQMDFLSQTYKQSGPELVRAKVLSQLGRIDSNFRAQALKELEKFALYSDILRPVGAKIEEIKLAGRTDPNELNWLITVLSQNRSERYRELVLQTALLQRKYDPNGFEKTLEVFPETKDVLGFLALSEISVLAASGEDLSQITVADAELAATVAWQTNPQSHADLITKLAESEKFQTPAVLYVAATLCHQTKPKIAVELLIKASNLQLKSPNVLLKKNPEDMAKQAFGIAYQVFTENPNDCGPAIGAYENYSRIAPGKVYEGVQYQYGTLLFDCAKIKEAYEILTPLAEHSKTIWRYEASLELLKMKMKTDTAATISDEILEQLRNFILDCSGPDENQIRLRQEAMNVYCSALFQRDSNETAEKILYILDKTQPTPGAQYELFRAQAFKQLGRLDEAVHFMYQAVDFNDASIAPQAVSILSEILDKIEIWEQKAGDFNRMLQDCALLADFVYKSNADPNTTLLLAEILILISGNDKAKLSQAERLLSDTNGAENVALLRCRARLLAAKADYQKAAELWARICALRKTETQSPNQRTWQWWQAKFYQLDCAAKLHDADKTDISHTIEVLLNTYPDTPLPWAEKLDFLKEECHNRQGGPVN
jgi:hypothetical protein